MKKITVNQLAKGLYLVKTDGSEGHNFPPIFKSLSWQLEAAGFAFNLTIEPIGNQMPVSATRIGPAESSMPEAVTKNLLRKAMKQMCAGNYIHPFLWDNAQKLIYVRISHLVTLQTMQTVKDWGEHINNRMLLRELRKMKLLATWADGKSVKIFEKSIDGKRVGHLVGLKLDDVSSLLDSMPSAD